MQQTIKKLAKFEMKALEVQMENNSLEVVASNLRTKIQNLEKDLKKEKLERERDKENYFTVFERFKKLAT